jgi:hypothetical protein
MAASCSTGVEAVRKVLDVILVLLFMEICFFLFKLAMSRFPA